MYPLLLKPPIKDYLWGGTKLKIDFGFDGVEIYDAKQEKVYSYWRAYQTKTI